MRRVVWRVVMAECALLTLAACAPAAPRAAAPQGGASGPTAAAPPSAPSNRTLTMMLVAEPDTLAGTALTARAGSTAGRRRLFNAGLILQDGDNHPLPYLAESLPQLNTESWTVLPDGRMETTYKLRADA